MTPPIERFPTAELPVRVQVKADGRVRKPPGVRLADCALHELVQYECELEGVGSGPKMIRCWPVVRLFRRCQDGLTVETTDWEKRNTREER